jgi:hypothetical protein
MSAIPFRTEVKETKPQLRVVNRSRRSTASAFWAHAALLSVVAFAVFMASSLMGHVAVETARKEGIEASQRARKAREGYTALEDRVNMLGGVASLQDWVQQNGYVAAELPAEPSKDRTLVASR